MIRKSSFLAVLLVCSQILINDTLRAESADQVMSRLGLPETLGKSLSFAATFDNGLDADFARGNGQLFSSRTLDRKIIDPALDPIKLSRVSGGIGSGKMLRFEAGRKNFLFYQVRDNFNYQSDRPWSGTISYWLKLSPDIDLPDQFVDPLQITQKAWNDAAFWNDFTKDDRPRKFRLGILADLKIWNPENRDFDKMPDSEKPAVILKNPPFQQNRWVNVTISFSNFNSGKDNGRAALYLDGELKGEIKGRDQRLSWDIDKAAILIGINYAGGFDNLLIFDRELHPSEIVALANQK